MLPESRGATGRCAEYPVGPSLKAVTEGAVTRGDGVALLEVAKNGCPTPPATE